MIFELYQILLRSLRRYVHSEPARLFMRIKSINLLQFLRSSIFSLPPSSPLINTSANTGVNLYYLIDLEYGVDRRTGFGRIPHLLVFNPGIHRAKLRITIFYEDNSPSIFERVVPAQTSSESDAREWPVPLNSRFALQIESLEPIIAQGTQGWNNTGNDYSAKSLAKDSNRPRETAKSYMSISSLSTNYYIADGIVIDAPQKTWIRETEDVAILNPDKTRLTVTISVYYGKRKATRWGPTMQIPAMRKKVQIAARRLSIIPLTGWVKPNWHYGAWISGDQPFAAQWLRKVYWRDSTELMSEWSVPCASIK